jgi:hypothetical protein
MLRIAEVTEISRAPRVGKPTQLRLPALYASDVKFDNRVIYCVEKRSEPSSTQLGESWPPLSCYSERGLSKLPA